MTEPKDVSILRIVIYERVPHARKPTYATQLISLRVRHLYEDGTSLAASLNIVNLLSAQWVSSFGRAGVSAGLCGGLRDHLVAAVGLRGRKAGCQR